ncbi:MAG: methyltransferase domain-containing protein [Nanoarchaeota archaeon]
MICGICGSKKIFMIGDGIKCYKCLSCGHLFKSVEESWSLDYYLENDYWWKGPELLLYNKMYLAFFEDSINAIFGGKTLVVGDATGEFSVLLLRYFLAKGIKHEVVYNEVSDVCSKSFLAEVKNRLIGDIKRVLGGVVDQFDNVFCINVVEHLVDPSGVFALIKDSLRMDGRLFIVTNDGDALDAYKFLVCERDHFNIFTRESLSLLLDKAGFGFLLYFQSLFDHLFCVVKRKEEVS